MYAAPLRYAAYKIGHLERSTNTSSCSIGEYRFIIIGISLLGKVLVVGHTDRDDRTRIIYARKATRVEKKFYEEYK